MTTVEEERTVEGESPVVVRLRQAIAQGLQRRRAAAPGEYAELATDLLAIFGRALEVDRGILALFDATSDGLELLAQWRADSDTHLYMPVVRQQGPFLQMFTALEPLIDYDVDPTNYPDVLGTNMAQTNRKVILVFPLLNGDRVEGLLTFSSATPIEALGPTARTLLDLVAEMFTNIIVIRRLQAGLRVSDERMRLEVTGPDAETAALIEGFNLDRPEPSDAVLVRLRLLSSREREVLGLLVTGYRVPTIARRLFLSQHTVRSHLKNIFRKLGVGSQSELIEQLRPPES